jgi:beta-lactamase superfamily II metal-dependent hydrolase
MKLWAFQSDKGDSLLLESKSGKHRMLIDGGMEDAYALHVAPAIAKLEKIDVVYVSHIDQDHIGGVLRMLDDEAAWRVHEHQKENGNPGHPKPLAPRPPKIGQIWHNSFHDTVGENAGAIEEQLAASASVLSRSAHEVLRGIAADRRDLATSMSEAIQVSHRIRDGQLGIPLNPPAGGKLMCVRKGEKTPIRLGTIRLRIIGPFPKDLSKLRADWLAWLKGQAGSKEVARLRAKAAKDVDAISASALDVELGSILAAADAAGLMDIALKKLGTRSKVTAPNLASLMFLAEESAQKILLTGDGHAADILAGLEHHDAFDANGRLHVDVLKVQHHGAEHNIDAPFCDRVTATHYVFSGNGEHENPDLDVLQMMFDRRMAAGKDAFTFWFNSTSTLSVDSGGRTHMRLVEDLVEKLVAKSKKRLRTRFIEGSSIRVV